MLFRSVREPRIFKTENCTTRSPGGRLKNDRSMIGGRAVGGGESGVRECGAPIHGDKNAVETVHDGRSLQIGPSELPIQERDLEQAQLVDEVIEPSGLSGVEILLERSQGARIRLKSPMIVLGPASALVAEEREERKVCFRSWAQGP